MPEILPIFDKLLVVAPIATIVVLVLFIGWYIRGLTSKEHIKTLKDFIDYLKEREK